MAEILNAHGSLNDIFVTELTPGDFASETDLRAFVRTLCDRRGPFGGDGVYFYDAAERPAPVAKGADERAQVRLGREVAGGELGDEDVVQRAVRVQDLGHRGPAYPNVGAVKLARAWWPAPP